MIPPHILIAGVRGSGVNTFLGLLKSKYEMSSVDLKNKFLEILERERLARRHERFLLKGFQAPEPRQLGDSDNEEEEEKIDPEEADADIQEEAEEFEKDKHE